MSHLLERCENGVATLTLNRPESMNAFSGEMMDGLLEAVPRLARDSSVGCIVVTGAGERAFSAGGDVKAMASGRGSEETIEERAHSLRERMELSRLLHEAPKPTVAAVRGAAAGAGLSVALSCDLRFASASARFVTAFARVGFSGDFGGSWFLTRLVGTAKARELYFLSDPVGAEEALALGIANRVLPDEDFDAEVRKFAERIAAGPVVALRYMKRNLNAAESRPLAECLDLEAWGQTRTGLTEDHKEAARAFVEKRPPTFKGR